MFKKSALGLSVMMACGLAQASVLTTIKPLGFIAAAITDGVTQTEVLLPVSASPHDYGLKPSDMKKLQEAELVVWIGEEMESFLEKSVEKLPKKNVLTLEEIEAIKAVVEAAEHTHEHHDHEEDDGHHHDHNHDEDWHIWLSPQASGHIAAAIAERVAEKYPDQQAKIQENLAQFNAALAQKNAEIQQQLSAYKESGYYTFHDAYGYFESAYGLNPLGSFTINPTIAPGAKTLQKIKANVVTNKAKCLFTEPQFTPKVVESLRKGTEVGVGQLDPLGAKIEMSKTAYFDFLQGLSDEFAQCLSK